MTQPLTPPTFSGSYNVAPMDIGSGYAKGISQAGQSIASAISGIMGGINQQTGEAEPGLLQQGQQAHDLIDIYHSMGMFDDDTYERLKTSGLGAQQKALGQFTAQAGAAYQSKLEMQRQLALEQAQAGSAMARTQVSEAAATGRSTASIQAELERTKLQLAQTMTQLAAQGKVGFVQPPPNQPSSSTAVPVPKLSLNPSYQPPM